MNQPDSRPRGPETAPVKPASLLSAKIYDHHLRRKSLVYVRQSSLQQVAENKESTARQYALRDRAIALGWCPTRVEVIDEDQGLSGQSALGRTGFQRLLAEVSLDHVGIILGLEMSRLARSCMDWHRLLEVCALFRTLLADQDGVYDPTDYNDRLLLGLKGTMSEAELHILKGRLHQGRLNKARRGELFNHAPIGYVRTANGEMVLDPDEQVQSVVRLIFDQFDRLGTLHSLLRYLVKHQIRIGVRPHSGLNRGNLEWHRPNRETLQNLLHHPIYAGYYRWGHRAVDPRRKVAGRRSSGRTVCKPQDCEVLLPDHCPAYITPDRFWANQKRLENNRNRAKSMGAPRQGPSLLGGLLFCGLCGRRMSIAYSGKANRLRYNCMRACIDYGEPLCQGLAGQPLDNLVATEVLKALEPAALELSLAAADDLQQQRQQLRQNWQQRLERARYESSKAQRQYELVDPANRLVARELERRWEEALNAQQQLEQEFARFEQTLPNGLSEPERERIRALAEDIPGLWQAETTSSADRQQIVRLLVERVVAGVVGESEQVQVSIHWVGGQASHHTLVRPVRRYEQLAGHQRLLQRIDELRQQGRSLAEVAEDLNKEGHRPPKRRATYNAAMVARLLSRKGRSGPRPKKVSEAGLLGENEWLLSDLARELEMPSVTLHSWRRRGWVRGRKLAVPGGHWALWADEEERERLRKLREYKRGWSDQPFPVELITPKTPPQSS